MTQFRFKIENGGTTYTPWYDEVGNATVTCVQALRLIYPDAAFIIERRASGATVPLPTGLYQDLQLNGFSLVGQLALPGLLIDGGVVL